MSNSLRDIYHISTELAGLVKVGGLADVVYGLSKKLLELNGKIKVILPYYSFLDKTSLTSVRKGQFDSNLLGQVTVYEAFFENIPLLLVQDHTEEDYFKRSSVYGESDDFDRFLWFTLACFEFLKTLKDPFIIHVHDWPTALLPALLKEYSRELLAKSILTIHNLRHQGRCSKKHLAKFFEQKISPNFFEKVKDAQSPSLINLMQAGIVFSDHITTVSPTYSEEIQTKELGYNLSSLIHHKRKKLTGILNGIDYEYWNPKTDPNLIFNYDATNVDQTLEAKQNNKNELFKTLGMKKTDRPLFACVTRLDYQKGPELILKAIETLLDLDFPVVLLGTPTSSEIEKDFENLALKHKDNLLFHYHKSFNEKLAHQIYASANYLLIPSIFEPCGLSQLIAMRYGTIPLVRKTGGLADTVIDVEDRKKATGIVFETPDKASVDYLVLRAIKLYLDPSLFRTVVKNAMAQDFSWEASAKKYQLLYETI